MSMEGRNSMEKSLCYEIQVSINTGHARARQRHKQKRQSLLSLLGLLNIFGRGWDPGV